MRGHKLLTLSLVEQFLERLNELDIPIEPEDYLTPVGDTTLIPYKRKRYQSLPLLQIYKGLNSGMTPQEMEETLHILARQGRCVAYHADDGLQGETHDLCFMGWPLWNRLAKQAPEIQLRRELYPGEETW